jgi:hypothetical protein
MLVALTTLVFWGIAAVALLMYTAGSREPTVHTLVIPVGTEAAIAAGENPLELPSTWSYYAEDRLVIHNEDGVTHWVGPWLVPANSSYEIEFHPVMAGAFVCSLHPAGEVAIDVQLRGFDFRQTLFPGLVFGPLLGLILVGTRKVIRLVDDDEGLDV